VTKLEKHGWLCSDTAEIGFADVRIPAGKSAGRGKTAVFTGINGDL